MTTSNGNQHAHCHCLYSASMIFRDNLVGPTESHGPVLPMMKCDSLQLLQHEAVELLICHRLWRSRGTSATGSLPATTPRGSRPRPRLRLGSRRLRSCKQPEQGLCQHRVGHPASNPARQCDACAKIARRAEPSPPPPPQQPPPQIMLQADSFVPQTMAMAGTMDKFVNGNGQCWQVIKTPNP